MKQINIISLLTIIMCMVGAKTFAHGIEVVNSDGKTIYYNRNGSSVSVTYRGTSHSSYSNEYTGEIVIPETVTYSGKIYRVISIESCAFCDCSGLTSVTIPNSVTSIGSSAFSDCSGLTSVTIGSSVTSIESCAFRGCSGLTSVTIPNSVTSIGREAFSGCSRLTSVTIPNKVTKIETSTFKGCSSLTSVTIPNSVTSIGSDAFYGCSGLTSVYFFFYGVTSIGSDAFRGCSGLTSVTIPNSVTSIGSSAFRDCSGLTSVTIPNSVTSIGYDAFYGCRRLTSVTIPNSVTSIGSYAFYGCSGLTSIKWNAKNYPEFSSASSSPFYDIRTQITEFIIGDEVTSIPKYMCYGMSNLKSVTIPNSVTSIGISAFYGSGLTSVTIPNSVTSIGTSAFYGSSLTSVTIPNNVTSIGSSAFGGCSGLTEIKVDNGNSVYDSRNDCNAIIKTSSNTIIAGCKNTIIPNSVTSIGSSAFSDCSGLTSVTIPNNVTSIGSSAFGGCSGLTSVTIPNKVTSIGDYAFSGCSGLTSMTIPKGVTSIGSSAFSGCNGLTSITWNAKNYPAFSSYSDNPFYYIRTKITEFIIGDDMTSIPKYMCYGMSNLESVTIGNSVTNIGYQAFYGCSGLKSITWNAKNYPAFSNYSDNPLYDIRTQITEFIIGDEVTSIPKYMCYGMSNLKSVTIPNSVTSIGKDAFYGCSGLEKVIVPNFDIKNWCSIDFSSSSSGNPLSYAHHLYSDENTEITKLVIPDDVTSIGNYAFYNCSGLTSVTIPNSVTSIGSSAFQNCSGLTSVSIPNSVSSIGDFAFRGCSGLTSVSIPNSVSSIGSYAFSSCSGLTSITIPNSVTSIGSSAFDGCSGLTSITWNAKNCPTFSNYSSNPFYDIRTQITEFIVGDEMTSIPKYMCYEMNNLESVTIGNNVTSIGSQAFYNTTIKSLTIGSGIQTIASDAFSYSSSTNGATPVKVVWLANTPPSGYENVKGTVNYVANNQYTKLSNATVYPFLNSMFEVGGIKYVPVSPSERTCDAIDCMYDASAENINIGKTVSFKGVALNVKDIKPYACYMNNNIKSIDISNDGSIGQFAFSQTGMEKAIIKNNGGIGNSAFRSCLKLKTVELGQYITDIGSSAFQSCRMLESIEIPDNVKTLGTGAFSGCTSLKSAKIGNGVSLLNTQTFSGCTSLENVEIGTNITKISGKSGTYSNYGCFYNCSSLEQIKVPGNVKEIEDYVFNGCTGLKNVIIDNADTELKLGSNGSSPIFSSCPLDSVYIGRNISYPTASSYGYSPFYRNTSLRTVHITDKETEISENEFYGCTNLKNVRIGDGVTYIGNWAFSGCSSIEYFSFGSAMQSIGKEAFSDCTAITKLISHAMTPPVCDSQALDDISKWVCTLSVPKGTVSSYQQAAQWKEFFLIDEFDTSEIENKEVNVILSSAGYATFYNAYNNFKIPVGLSAQVVTFDSYGNLSYNTIANGIIPKGVPVILKSNNKRGGTYTLTSTTESATYSGENLLHGSSSQTMTSNVNGVSTSGNSSYVYYKLAYGKSGSVNANKFGWYWGANNGAAFSIEGGKAWLALPITNAQSKRAVLFIDDDMSIDDATSIDDIEQSCNNEANSIQYNMAGQRVDNSYNGIIIVNGKKIVR